MVAPKSAEEAQAYVGRTFWKFFKETGHQYEGVIEGIDTELVNEAGETETGIFFRVRYFADDDQEHLMWPQMSKLLKAGKGAKKRKNEDVSPPSEAAANGSANPNTASPADVAAVNDNSNKRQRRAAGQLRQEANGHHAAAAAADGQGLTPESAFETPAPGLGGQHGTSRRNRSNHKQQQQVDETPVMQGQQQPQTQRGSASQRTHRRKQGRPHQLLPSPPQQMRDDEEDEDAIPDSQEEEEEASDDYEPQQQQQEKQKQPSKRARKQQQQEQEEQAADADQEMPEDDQELNEEELQEFEEATRAQQHAAADRFAAGDIGEDVVVRSKGLAGHIKHVQVQNFMCHQNFMMEFGTHVNIISGSNGSGKSAVLQAMQAALGAKAKDTGRGDNFRELVRTGCQEAKVKVTVWNTGEDAFQHDQYGDWITIERTIKAGPGANTYRIYNQANKKVAEGFKQLSHVLDHLNVEASNPLAVLTQDTARNFLCGSVADKKKYELFMRATMLQAMFEALQRASGYVDQMKEAFKEVEEKHKQLKKAVDEVQDKLQKLLSLGNLAAKRTMYERAAEWVYLKGRMDMRERVRENLEVKAPQKREKIEQALATANARLGNLRAEEDQLLAAQKAEQENANLFADRIDALNNQAKTARLEHRAKLKAAEKLQTEMKRLHIEIKQITEAKRETNDDRQAEYEAKLAQHQADMDQARQNLQQAEAQLQQCQQQEEGIRETLHAKEEEIQQLQLKQQYTKGNLMNLQQNLQQLNAAKGQKLAMFGPHAQLRQLVDRNRSRFDRLPIGPVGAHLTLTDPKWGLAAEVVLGGDLETWLVHSDKDNKMLRALSQQAEMRAPTVLVANFDRPAYRVGVQLPAGWHCLREFVTVEHPQYGHIIDNKLMDKTHYERVVVDEDSNRAADAAYKRAAGNQVTKAVDVSGRNWTIIRNGVMASNYTGRPVPRVSGSVEQQRTQTEAAIMQCQAEAAQQQQQRVAANAQLQQLRQQANDLNRQTKLALGNKNRAAYKVSKLAAQMPVPEIDEADGEDFIADQLRAVQDKLNTAQLHFDKANMELQEAAMKDEQAKKLYEDRQAEVQQTLTQMNSRQEELDKLASKKAEYITYIAACTAKLQVVSSEEEQLKQNLATITAEIDAHKQECLKSCTEEEGWAALAEARAETRAVVEKTTREQWADQPRQQYDSSEAFEAALVQHVEKATDSWLMTKGVQYLQQQANKLDKKITEAEREAGGNQEELELHLRKAERDFKKYDTPVKNMSAVKDLASQAVEARMEAYERQYDDVLSTLNSKFMNYMHRRGHQGKVKVDQSTGELKLLVKINTQGQGAEERKKAKAVRDLKQLSGGERSYTTVAFILALGEMTENPFRAMDEFDVFMDAINRRIATQTLLEFALAHSDRQFVLLTPQDLQAVEDAKKHLAESKNGRALPEGFVKVVQMRPARPGQHHQQQHH